ncbi:MAG: AAA family ATPase [Planctomycetales bacterium]|nr:AAA family ATPase [Planctomycetales bacterium]
MHTVVDPQSLQPEEQSVVELAAANRGSLEVSSRSDTRGLAVRGGKQALFKPDDPSYSRRCCDAVSRLIELQLIRQAGGKNRFELTNFGWELSRKLTNNKRKITTMDEPSPIEVTQVLSAGRRGEEAVEATLTSVEAALRGDEPPSAAEASRTREPDVLSWGDEPSPHKSSLLTALGLEEGFLPEEPGTLEETGLSAAFIDDLMLKVVRNAGSMSGRQISEHVGLPMGVLEDRLADLRRRRHLTPTGSAMLGDHVYQLTEDGRERAQMAMRECAYAGVAPVPLEDYADSVQAQTIRSEKPKRAQLAKAFADINVEPAMLAKLGPAISAGKGMFIYGPPGNGKTTIAQRITRCFGQHILIPHAIVEDGQIIKFFDPSCHEPVQSRGSKLLKETSCDRRWVRIRRPTVVVGGELTMESLELKHDPVSHVSGASLQLKSNCGSLLIDDFGRQRINPSELLNRWIIPLENRIDFLSLENGKKVEVPFEQLIVFSTNLEPTDLADDAFLRRIPFKIEVGAPSREEFVKLLQVFAGKLKVECPDDSVQYLLTQHYDSCRRPLRRCQARDLLDQVAHYCEYNELPPVATPEILDHAVANYFTVMSHED